MAVDTLYRPQAGGGGSGSTDYIKDCFQDISRRATNNSGLTSSAATNPLTEFFNDSDSPQYGLKTLFIKGLVPIADKTKWINFKPTFEIKFTEDFPQVKAYAYGNVRILDTQTGFSLFLSDVDDACGVVGNIRQAAWIVNSTPNTATVTPYLDSVSGSVLTFGSAALDATSRGLNNFNLLLQNTTAASNDLHDFRIEADQAAVTRVAGLVCYFQNASSNIQARPGSTYVNKTLATASSGEAIALPVLSGRLGAKTLIHKTAAGAYALSTLEPINISSVGVGASGTNLIDVSTGHGASFPVGTLVGSVSSGSSFYFGLVQSQSTDTLTLGQTLGFGASGPIFKFGYAGTTFSVGASYYKSILEIDPERVGLQVNVQGFGATTGTLFYQDPESRFRLWGSNLTVGALEGVPGFGFAGASGFLQIDGKFSAIDFEHLTKGILHATFSINGLNCFGINAGFSGLFKKSILTDSGPGHNSVVITPGASFAATGNIFSKFTLYDLSNQGVTAGLLAEFPTYIDTIPRSASNATLMQLGAVERHYADELYLTGAWTRATGASFAGAVAYYGASTNSTLKFQYYGTNFALLGTAGGSMTATLDGASIGFSFGAMKSVATLGWHSVQLAYNAGATTILEGISVLKPQRGELKSLQKYNSDDRFLNIPAIFQQSQTPAGAKDGDLWLKQGPLSVSPPQTWLKAFGIWLQIPIINYADDPNYDELYVAGGDAPTVSATTQRFNAVAWSQSIPMTAAKDQMSTSACDYNSKLYAVGGVDSSPAIATTNYSFNKASWSTETANATARQSPSTSSAYGFLFVSKGQSLLNDQSSYTTTCRRYNGSSWADATAWGNSRFAAGSFFVGGIFFTHAGQFNTTTNAELEARNAADSVSASTSSPANMSFHSSVAINYAQAISAHGVNGAAGTAGYTWNGAAWSSVLTAPLTTIGAGAASSQSRSRAYVVGGSGGSTGNYSYNAVSFVSGPATTVAVQGQPAAASF